METRRQSEKTVARRAVRAVVTGDMDELERVFAQDVRLYSRGALDAPGISGVRERALMFAAALWDCSLHISYTVQTDDVVVTRWAAECLHKGWTATYDEPRQPVRVTGTSIMRIRHGQVVDDWTQYEGLRHGEVFMESAS